MSEYKLEITLKSDICPGSGYAYSGLIDSDVCFDDKGIPFIPGRRLKGCLKECADILEHNGFLSSETVSKIFGKTGEKDSGAIIVGDAVIENYDTLYSDLKAVLDSDLNKSVITTQKVLEQFTSVKAQTRMENGVAKDDSLRYTRVVNQYGPDEKVVKFTSKVSLDKDYFEDVKSIVKTLRNIGLNRTRGLGSVVCKLEKCNDEQNNREPIFEGKWEKDSDEKEVEIDILIKNTAPLMISADNDEVSLRYIPGQNVIGAFAAAYLKEYESGEEFEHLFLDGTTRYSNLYITDAAYENSNEIIPAPSFINCLKKTKKFVNMLEDSGENLAEELKTDGGNMPKKIKDKYISIIKEGEKTFVDKLYETEMQIDYHHTKKSGDNNDEPILYTNEVIKKGQIFAGKIITKSSYLDIFKNLLDKGILRFGKSKSAQYGTCRILSAKVNESKNKTYQAVEGDKIYVSLISDGIFMNDRDYTVRYDEIKQMIAKATGIDDNYCKGDKLYSFVSTGLAFGYNRKWNLRKAPVSLVSAGSTFVFEMTSACEITEKCVGERIHEGFGRIKIFKNVGYDMNSEPQDGKHKKYDDVKIKGITKTIVKKIISDELLMRLPEVGSSAIDNTQLGRMTLMLKESKSDMKDFCNRIDSIKSESTRAEAIGWLKGTKLFYTKEGKLTPKKDYSAFGFKTGDKDLFEIYEKITGEGDFRQNFVGEHISKILMTYLTNEKYKKKLAQNTDTAKKEVQVND